MKKSILLLLAAMAALSLVSCRKVVDDSDNLMDASEISSEPANCYMVTQRGPYKIKTVKGNSSESVGAVANAEVIWESYGTDVRPARGTLISKISYADGYISFSTTVRKGNALIAAKDAEGNILWSWHIWLTDKPAVRYCANAGVSMMDRNLGAISTLEGSAESLGLIYQWGRKDPFLASSNTVNAQRAGSTISWPAAVNASDVLVDGDNTLAYATAHPTVFITNGYEPYDWFTTSPEGSDDSLWSSTKSIYDPCPAGYRVPDGGASGVWATAFGSAEHFTDQAFSFSESALKGVDFGPAMGADGACWYPAAGQFLYHDGSLDNVGISGNYWSCTSDGMDFHVRYFSFSGNGSGYPAGSSYRASGYSVRCCKE